jgi:serine/threonine protein kinase
LQAHLGANPPFLVYEYVEGGDLGGLIQEWHRSRQGPTPREAARVLLRLAKIVGHAHRLRPPIAHRDLKPANILVQPKGESGRQQLKIADFGIGGVVIQRALRGDRKGTTSLGQRRSIGSVGAYTALYASPQQVRGDPP